MGFPAKYLNRLRYGLALAGGGAKTFYSLGLSCYLHEQGIRYKAYSGTSAGSAITIADALGNHRDVFHYFVTLIRNNPKNFYWKKFFSGKTPFPHLNMYRKGIRRNLNFERLKKCGATWRIPAVVIGGTKLGKPDRKLYRTYVLFFLTMQYLRDQKDLRRQKFKNHLRNKAKDLNLQEVIFTEADFTSPEMVEKIVLVSSSAPPVLQTQKLGNNYLLDGALYTNLPIGHLFNVDVKIAVAYHMAAFEHYQALHPDALVLAPSKKLGIHTFEYASVEAITEAFELGYTDGQAYHERIEERMHTTYKSMTWGERVLRRFGGGGL